MITHKKYYQALNIVREYKEQIMKEVLLAEKDANILITKVDNLKRFEGVTSETILYDTHISLRLFGAIRISLDTTFDEIGKMKLSEI